MDEGHRKQWAAQLYIAHTFLHDHGAVSNNLLIVDAGHPRFVKGFSKRSLRSINRDLRLKDEPPFTTANGADGLEAAAPSASGRTESRNMRPSGAPSAPTAGGVESAQALPRTSSNTSLPNEGPDGVDSLDGSSTGRSAIPRSDVDSLRSLTASSSGGSTRTGPVRDSADSDVSGSGIDSVDSTRSRAVWRGPPESAVCRRVPATRRPRETVPRGSKRSRRS